MPGRDGRLPWSWQICVRTFSDAVASDGGSVQRAMRQKASSSAPRKSLPRPKTGRSLRWDAAVPSGARCKTVQGWTAQRASSMGTRGGGVRAPGAGRPGATQGCGRRRLPLGGRRGRATRTGLRGRASRTGLQGSGMTFPRCCATRCCGTHDVEAYGANRAYPLRARSRSSPVYTRIVGFTN